MRVAKNSVIRWPLPWMAVILLCLLGWTSLISPESVLIARAAVHGDPSDQQPSPLSLDCYGGILVQVSDASGFFRVQKVNNRWVFVTPAGNAFWVLGVFNVDTTSSVDDLGDSYEHRIIRKYGDKFKWSEQTVRRMKSWGFNTLAEYATSYVLPTPFPYGDWSNPEQMPFMALVRPAFYSLRNFNQWGGEPVKDLIAPLDSHYRGYRGTASPDLWDPHFEQWLDNALQNDPYFIPILNSPWLIGIVSDDTDDLWGFGAGPDFPTEPPGHTSDHLGWIVLLTPPKQEANASLGVKYRDTKVYSKYALRDFLAQKYGSIGKLNVAWGSTYTTFDSDGGWPNGRGLLDENGKGSWVGADSVNLNDAAPQVKADLDNFLFQHARKYFSLARSQVKKHAANNLYLGPTVIGSWGVPARKEILQAARGYVDVLQTKYDGSQETLDFMARYAGDLPILSWEGAIANPDSALFRYQAGDGPFSFHTQADRGFFYNVRVTYDFDRAVGDTGIKPIVGIKLWELVDNWGEKANWGLVTFSDDAYDGKEAVTAPGLDPWGYPIGGEERGYGDFISSVRQTNLWTVNQLLQELQAAGNSPGGGSVGPNSRRRRVR